ncbi:hypothetical protein WAI453_002852 [Rhynchosporium graminicola]
MQSSLPSSLGISTFGLIDTVSTKETGCWERSFTRSPRTLQLIWLKNPTDEQVIFESGEMYCYESLDLPFVDSHAAGEQILIPTYHSIPDDGLGIEYT